MKLQKHILLCTTLYLVNATSTQPPPAFSVPPSAGLDLVNLLIGNGGDTPNGSGGMIPSTAPPFSMTRWVAQNQVHYVSATPYNWTLDKVMGVVGTRQPAIWMGESAPISVSAGVGDEVQVDFEQRGLDVIRGSDGQKKEVVSSGYYSVELDDKHGGTIKVEQSATSRVAHLRFTFSGTLPPHLLFQVSRPSIVTSDASNVTYPLGAVSVQSPLEICGWSNERQDWIIAPTSIAPFSGQFKGYFCARFDSGTPQPTFGIIQNTTTFPAQEGKVSTSPLLSAYAKFPKMSGADTVITLRVGTSFISQEQARTNLETEIQDVSTEASGDQIHLVPGTFENTAYLVRKSWTDLLNRVEVQVYADGRSVDPQSRDFVDLQTFWTGVVHTLQYPSEQHEGNLYYSGYDNEVHQLPDGGESYTGYSIWDTYRAEWAWQILFVPDRIPGMVQSMLADYQEGGWLPMWKNVVETNIMVATHADSLIAEAVLKNITGIDRDLAWEAVWKDATVPPKDDATVVYSDREEHVDYEVRAGLSTVFSTPGKGWVADDVHSESASRTLDYSYDDYAAYVLARELGKPEDITQMLFNRSMVNAFQLFNDETGFMEARNADGSWAGPDNGWTEGDKWAYSFDVVHDVPTLIERRGGKIKFVQSLEDHFNGGHNDQSNEPSHHIPYMYSMAGAAFKSQERVREIAIANYNNTPTGLSGNEDCGQMSAWYIFSAMGFYPVNPVSGEYIVGSPFFEKISIALEGSSSSGGSPNRNLIITALGARTKPYIKSLTIDGVPVASPVIRHAQIAHGAEIVFEMSAEIEAWGNDPALVAAFGPGTVLTSARDGDTNGPQVSMPLPRGTRDKNSDDAIRDEL